MVPSAYNGSYWEITLDFTPVEAKIAVLKQLQRLELPTVDDENSFDDSYLEGQKLQLASFGWNEVKEKYGEEDGLFKFYEYEGSSDCKLREADVKIYEYEEYDKENIRRVSNSYLSAKMLRRYMSEWVILARKKMVGIVHTRI